MEHDNVHDHGICALSVDFAKQRLVLHTVCDQPGPEQFIDVVFDGVVAYRFTHETFGSDWQNCLLAVDEDELQSQLSDFVERWKSGEGYHRPMMDCSNEGELVRRLGELRCKFFSVLSCYGLGGYVIAAAYSLQLRPSRYEGAQSIK